MLHTRVAPKGQVCVSLLRERPEQGEGMGTKGDEGWWHPDISLKAARGQLGLIEVSRLALDERMMCRVCV